MQGNLHMIDFGEFFRHFQNVAGSDMGDLLLNYFTLIINETLI